MSNEILKLAERIESNISIQDDGETLSAPLLYRHEWNAIVSVLRAAAASAEPVAPFQRRVQGWMMQCFSMEICRDRQERNHRFLEEALELVQSIGCTAGEAHQLVDYVFGRDLGDVNQEVGGVMVTLAALCWANDIDMHQGGEIELARILRPEIMNKIRAKQASKPKHSPLPAHPAPDAEIVGALEDVFSHQDVWRRLLVAQQTPIGSDDDGSYWAHELKVFDRTLRALAKAKGGSRT